MTSVAPVVGPGAGSAGLGSREIAPRASTSRLDRIVAGVVSGGVLALALVYCGASLALSSRIPLVQFAFEPVVVMACVVGLLFAAGKFRWAPAITLVCVAGTIAVASVLVYRGMLGQVEIAGRTSGWSLKPWLLARLAGAGVLMLVAAMNVVVRDGRAVASFVRGLVATVPLALAAGGCYVIWSMNAAPATATPVATNAVTTTPSVNGTAGGPTSTTSTAPAASLSRAMPGWMYTGLMVFLGITAGVSLCAAGHFFIRAFEIGADVGEGREPEGVAKA